MFEVEAIKRCPYCGEEILAVAIKCKHCGSTLSVDSAPQAEKAPPRADYAWILLGIPLAATVLIWGWVSNMNLLEGPGNTLAMILVAVVISTAAVTAVEVSKGGPRPEGTTGPAAWGALVLLLWIIGYPAYLFNRRNYGLRNHLAASILVMILFLGSFLAMSAAIDAKVSEIKSSFQSLSAPTPNSGGGDDSSATASGTSSDDAQTEQAPDQSRPIQAYTAEQLYAMFHANEIKANQTIGNAMVRVTGTINSIQQSDFSKKPELDIRAGCFESDDCDDPNAWNTFRADLTAAEASTAAGLKIGQTITLQCNEVSMPVDVYADGCAIVPENAESKSPDPDVQDGQQPPSPAPLVQAQAAPPSPPSPATPRPTPAERSAQAESGPSPAEAPTTAPAQTSKQAQWSPPPAPAPMALPAKTSEQSPRGSPLSPAEMAHCIGLIKASGMRESQPGEFAAVCSKERK